MSKKTKDQLKAETKKYMALNCGGYETATELAEGTACALDLYDSIDNIPEWVYELALDYMLKLSVLNID